MANYDIKFQDGDPAVTGQNGLLIEEAILQICDRINVLNLKSSCAENAGAITHLLAAKKELDARAIRLQAERKKK